MTEDRRIAEVVAREQGRLRNFIRRRVADPRDVDDILQDVLFALVEANRLVMPIDHITAWLFRAARNRIVDFFRMKKPEPLGDSEVLLPSLDAGPDAEFVRSALLDEIEAALEELPAEQREVFVAHELEGRSFKEISAATGVSVNTLLSRKHYAVQRLRVRLQSIYDDLDE